MLGRYSDSIRIDQMLDAKTPARGSPAFVFEVDPRSARADAAVVGAWAARPIGLRARLCSAEKKFEETRPAVAATIAAIAIAAIHADRHAHWLGRHVGRAFDRNFGDLAFAALEDSDHFRIAAVNVLAQLQLAILIHVGGLIGQVNPDRLRKIDVDL